MSLVVAAPLIEGDHGSPIGPFAIPANVRSANPRSIRRLVIWLDLAFSLCADSGLVVLDLTGLSGVIPAQDLRHDFCCGSRCQGAAIEGFDRNSCSSGQNVVQMESPLAGSGVVDLRGQVRGRAFEGGAESGVFPNQVENFPGPRAVTAEEVLDDMNIEAGFVSDGFAPIPMGLIAVGSDKGNRLGAARGHLLFEAPGGDIDDILCHDAGRSCTSLRRR